MGWFKWLLAHAAIALAVLAAGAQARSTRAPWDLVGSNSSQPVYFVRSPSFETCEMEGFIALGLARQAIFYKVPKDELLKANDGSFQVASIEELFSEETTRNVKNHAWFGSKKFFDCVTRENLPIPSNIGGAAVCLARQDIQFFASASKSRGDSQETALAAVKKRLGSEPAIYPPELIEFLVAAEYRAQTEDGEFELRRFIFESCLLPDEWKQWYQSTLPGS